jgi:uncharacterized protein YbjQ (UPF0145 family)
MPITTGLSGNELYCLRLKGFTPGELLVGNSVHSLGVISGIGAGLRGIMGGEVTQVSEIINEGRHQSFERIIHDAREHAVGIIRQEAADAGADDVVGVKVHIHEMGNFVEFMAVGTAVKRLPGMAPLHEQLPPQAVIVDRETWKSSGDLFSTAKSNRRGE